MPNSMHILDAGLPRFKGTESTEDKVAAIQNYLYMLLEELRYLLRHLGAENFTQEGAQEVLAQAMGESGGDTVINNFLEQNNVFETIVAETIINNSFYTNEMYAAYGEVADLTVWRLRTDYMRAQNYLRGNRGDLNYIDIHEEQMDFITGSVKTPLRAVQLVRDGLAFYWTDETRTRMTFLEATPWPVMVYEYDEEVKLSIRFESIVTTQGAAAYAPVFILGAGDENGNSKGYLFKEQTGTVLRYQASDGSWRTLNLSDTGLSLASDSGHSVQMAVSGYTDIAGLRKTTEMDFSGWDSGYFTETVDGNLTETYSVDFDSDGYPILITDGDGHECEVIW